MRVAGDTAMPTRLVLTNGYRLKQDNTFNNLAECAVELQKTTLLIVFNPLWFKGILF